MTSLAQWLRRLRTLCWTALSIVIISAAILVGVGKLLMPYSDRYQPQLESWLSREFGYPVTVETFSGEWRAFGPRLMLQGLRIRDSVSFPGNDDLLISEAALDIKPLSLLWPGQSLYSFLVIGAELQLVRDDAGHFHLAGLGLNRDIVPGSPSAGTAQEASGLGRLVGVGELRLENSRLDLLDEQDGGQLHFSNLNAELQLSEKHLAVKLESSLVLPESGLNFGNVDAVARIQLGPEGGISQAFWQVGVADLLLVHLNGQLPSHPLLPRQGRLKADIWGSWAPGQPLENNGSLELTNTWLSNGRNDLMLDRVSATFASGFSTSDDWRLDLHDARLEQGENRAQLPGLTAARDVANDVGLWLGADYLPLYQTTPVARQLLEVLDLPLPATLPQQVSGSLSAFDLVLGAGGNVRWLGGEIRDLGLRDWPGRPGLEGLNGQISLQAGSGHLRLHSPTLVLDWPDMFAYPLQFSLPDCRGELQLGQAWQVMLRSCHVFNNDASVQGDAIIAASPGRPAVDLNVDILRLDAARLDPYWPQGIMPAAVTRWLRANLHHGEVSSGRLQIFGDMDDWPFRHGEGRFEARARVENAELSFAPGWPALRQVNATAEFIGAGMRVEGHAADFAGVPVEQAVARIERFGAPLLQVDFSGGAQAGKVLAMLQQTPVLPAGEFDLSRFSMGGSVQAKGRLEIPFGKTPGKLRLDGTARVSKGSFVDQDSGVRLDGIAGRLGFDQQRLWSESLAAEYKGKAAKLDLQVGGDERWGLVARLDGLFAVSDLLPEYFLNQPAFVQQFGGSSDWQARITVPRRNAAGNQPVMLELESDLRGTRIGLPAPLAKNRFERWPIRLQYPLTGDSRLLHLELNDELRLAAELDTSVTAADALPRVARVAVLLGHGQPVLPAPGRLSVEGMAGRIDLDGWVDIAIDHAGSNGNLAGLQLEKLAVQADEMIFLDRAFRQTGLAVALGDTTLRADFAGADISGHMQFTTGATGRNSLNAEFERLALGKPLSSGMDTETNPADLPELHLYARSFRYAGLEMGETRVEAYPTANGFHFEKVEADSKDLSVRASGDWSLLEQGQRSEFDIMMTAESLGELLQSLDISSSLVGGQTVLEFDAWWPGSPAAFALARLNGEIEFSVTRGQITNANTGTGKVLGLLSIQSLPRRLALDFRDVFDSGFSFETASGTFQMENGTASTNDVKLTSSAANIELSGSTNLVKQQYDQQMTVMPGVGNTLPVIGAIAAGPGGAAAGLALQGLLHEQLGKATQVQYTITGDWDEPVIEPILKTGDRDTAPQGDQDSG